MCAMCDPETGETAGCQDCGKSICFDDDTAYVTASGDVYCRSCGRSMDEAEEAEWDTAWDFYGASWYDPDVPLPEDEENPLTYIGPDAELDALEGGDA